MLNVLKVFVALVLIVKCTNSQTSPFPLQFTGPGDHLRTRVPPTEAQFRVVYEWRVIDFAFPLEQLRLTAIYNHDYIPQNNLISDVKAFANRLYVTMPRMLPGVPATLGWVCDFSWGFSSAKTLQTSQIKLAPIDTVVKQKAKYCSNA